MTATTIDPLTLELVRNGLETLADEMSLTIARAAYSPILRNSNDYSTALLTASGEVMAQGRTSPVLLGGVMTACAAVRARFEGRMRPGDVFLVNDPYEGGTHLPDLFVIKPLFRDGEVVAFAGAESHHADIGGSTPGSNAADSREIFAEGLRIPPSHLYREGEPNETLFDLLDRNCRFPDRVRGDLGGQLAALRVADQGFAALGARHGEAVVDACARELLDYGERMARAEIQSWPDGDYTFEDWIDDDGFSEAPILIRARLTIDGDRVEVDFTGSGDQVESAINNPGTFTRATVLVAVRCAMRTDMPHNSGYMRAVDVHAPEGSIVNPLMPAAVSARTITAFRAFDATLGCLAQAVPERAMAASHGSNTLMTLAGEDGAGRPYVLTDIHFGAWGGRHNARGVDGLCAPLVQISNTPIETIEREMPLLITRYELVADTGGAGQFRGGLGVARGYRVRSGRALAQVRTDRGRVAPYGLFGGRPGALASNVVERSGSTEQWPAKHTGWLETGDAITAILAGGGGWGDPAEADPAMVAADVQEEKLSPGAAKEAYGVIDEAGGH